MIQIATSPFTCQMLYDSSGNADKYRKLTFNSLAWWHTYKAACNKLWSRYANAVFAPLFHALDPQGWFFKQNKYLSKTVHMFTMIRVAYPRFRDALKAAIADRTVRAEGKTHLKNLYTLCEFFIPVVCYTTTITFDMTMYTNTSYNTYIAILAYCIPIYYVTIELTPSNSSFLTFDMSFIMSQ